MATDIVARGIDIDEIAMVVNYDAPREAEDYVHRIGRTARANAEGRAVTFISERDQSKFGYIERFLGYEVRKEAVPQELGEAPEYKPAKRSGSGKGRNSGRNQGRGRGGRNRGQERGQGSDRPKNNEVAANGNRNNDSQRKRGTRRRGRRKSDGNGQGKAAATE